MRIWLDLANSPQVLFFRPILSELQRRGHEVHVTTRAYAQTTQLADRFGFRHTPIGRHGGTSGFQLVRQLSLRALTLARWGRLRHFDLALSHNSYSQIVAAALLRVPSVTLMDYEHQPLNHLAFRLASQVIVPEAFPMDSLRQYGAIHKTATFPGVKEQVYLADFAPQSDYRQRENLPTDCPLVVIRPPAPWTAYHRFENDLFDELLSYLAANVRGYLLFLPRLSSQADSVGRFSCIHVATKVYDGPNLLHNAALVISGGGTMNREAAVLGAPTFTVFKGKLGSVDRYLIAKGRMAQLQTKDDFCKLRLVDQPDRQALLGGRELVAKITDQLLETT